MPQTITWAHSKQIEASGVGKQMGNRV